jgi:hypothetical protein
MDMVSSLHIASIYLFHTRNRIPDLKVSQMMSIVSHLDPGRMMIHEELAGIGGIGILSP